MSNSAAATTNTFDNDLELLSQHFAPLVLNNNGRRIAVLAELQGRVMHASTPDTASHSIGWLNRSYLSEPSIALNGAIGGADRLWFGPDGGKFTVFFEPKAETKPENIRPPKPLTFDAFKVTSKSADSATFEHQFSFQNHLGFEFNTHVSRTVSVFDEQQVETDLGLTIPKTVEWVAYGSKNTATNIGDASWQAGTGLFSLWVLGMFEPEATVVIPLRNQPRKELEKATNYFVPPTDEKVRIAGNTLFYNADALLMNKIGVPITHTLPILGSYDKQKQRLTIIKFSFDASHTDYVNAVWDWQAPALKGEVINVFNDGPQADGKPFGPFYEMETSSRALALAPSESETHSHQTYHFVGEPSSLDPIARALLGVSLAEIERAFTPGTN